MELDASNFYAFEDFAESLLAPCSENNCSLALASAYSFMVDLYLTTGGMRMGPTGSEIILGVITAVFRRGLLEDRLALYKTFFNIDFDI